MSETQYKTEEYVVAFIDVLGASAKIKKNANESLNVVHKAYNEALRMFDVIAENEQELLTKPTVRIFSDNIVIAAPTASHGRREAFNTVVIFSALTQIAFLTNEYLVRGGLVMGDFFVDETMIWGNALLNSYGIENSVAIYPRIVIHPETVRELKLEEQPLNENWLQKDTDFLLYVDYFKLIAASKNFPFFVILKKHVDEAEKMLEDTKKDVKVYQKINWHRWYLMRQYHEFKEKYDGGAEDA